MPHFVNAAFFNGNGSIVVREILLADPGPGEVLVNVRASGVCGSDLHQFAERWEQPDYAVGHEIAGEVCALGDGVENVRVGDRVCVEPFIFCGGCNYCRDGRYFMCPEMGFLTLTEHGGFADKVLIPAYGVYRLPDSVSLEIGALAEPCAVAVHAARLAHVDPADEVLVLGAGTIGLMAVAAAKHFGARKVYITARYPHQRDMALALGADGVLSTEPEVLSCEVKEHFPTGPDVVLEAVGSRGGTFQQALDLAGKLARVALMGGNTEAIDRVNLAPVIMKELVIYGSGCYSQIGTRRDFEIAVDVLAAGPDAFEKLITHRFSLSEIQTAFEVALGKSQTGAVKVMVVGE